MSSYAFVTVDVFTDRRFAGNPLLVVPDARGLTDEAMQAIAREINYSESTFVLPPRDPAHTAEVRIFTPVTEVPFAGHPNVGTAFVLARQADIFGKAPGDQLIFAEKAGLVSVALRRDATGVVCGADIVAPEPFSRQAGPPPVVLAEALALPAEAIATAPHPPVIVSVGLPFIVAALKDLEALAAASPDAQRFQAADRQFPTRDGQFCTFLYVRDPEDHGTVRARMFAPLDNVPEDPATGSASGALAGLLATLDPASDGETRLTIDQGVEMGRPSRLEVTAEKRGGTVTRVTIGGHCVTVMRGEITV
ncbi:PhzF family phenazine biosynthesis protein [Rhizobium sp. CC-YZS058]|uniref:PhzF family phenazine biosynthesis protein n=1 Tax=Rhizobium sp. CC-YZS058 TaxID=3042153 RepID=UPI002B052CF6|nr:PhzF family phenazine biosynthesis protein [Rhizobium sp. CC-YZS058]MEA3533638.1 PhzF family phenazine biosynthesis protein [Rhizobium sp. CC-YZS058]